MLNGRLSALLAWRHSLRPALRACVSFAPLFRPWRRKSSYLNLKKITEYIFILHSELEQPTQPSFSQG